MSRQHADKLLEMVGPGSILVYNCHDSAVISALLQSGCDAYGWVVDAAVPTPDLDGRITRVGDVKQSDVFDTVIIDMRNCGSVDLKKLIEMLRHHIKRTLLLDFSHLDPATFVTQPAKFASNQEIEAIVLSAGFRRHLACFPVSRYLRLNDSSPEPLIGFELLSGQTLARWPMETLLENRDLHMDMSREASARSDAHLVRYALAAEWVRPGDTVLDCACGLGYGTALLAAASNGKRFIGVDIDPQSVAYAQENFASYAVEYLAGSALDLSHLPSHSVDLVVSFETIEHLENYETFIDEIARVVKPDGRVIGSVPHMWVDETGRDPNPHHFHSFDYARVRDALGRHFTVEARYAQAAPGGVKLFETPRSLDLRPLTLGTDEPDTEWWIVVASAKPTTTPNITYTHPEFDRSINGTQATITDFANCYDNPWTYRTLIQNGQRIRDVKLLAKEIDSVAAHTSKSSADFGAMLAVKSYKALLDNDTQGQAALISSIETYLLERGDNPHVYRWKISLSYVAALMLLSNGKRALAMAMLTQVTQFDPLRFSPLISTKTISAHFLHGTMHLIDGDRALARASFVAGVEVARAALHAPDENAIGRADNPLVFGFFELAEIADMGGQCAIAIRDIDQFDTAPAQFWRSIETKRFGMLAWLRGLENDNAKLVKELAQSRHEPTIRKLLPKRISELWHLVIPAVLSAGWNRLLRITGLR